MTVRAVFVDMRAEGGGHLACMATISEDRSWALGWSLISSYARRLAAAGVRTIYVEQDIPEADLWCHCNQCDRNQRLASSWLRRFEGRAPNPT